MSKTVLNTRQQILATALQAFNKQGIEAAGVRDLAALLKLSAGNVTYYFPTRDDMVKELIAELDANIRVFTDKVKIESVADFFGQQKLVMDIQFQYRCLYLAYGALGLFNKKVGATLKKFEKRRTDQLKAALQGLMKSGQLEKAGSADMEALLTQIQGHANYWIVSAMINNPSAKKEQALKIALHGMAFLLNPYLTKKGKGELAKALKTK
jgi:AcrR family transcriptional regulator